MDVSGGDGTGPPEFADGAAGGVTTWPAQHQLGVPLGHVLPATGRVVGDVEAAAIPAVAVKATAVSAPGPSVPGATRAHVVDAEVVGGEPTVASAAPIVSGHVVAAAPRS